jgi:hypothetical protein
MKPTFVRADSARFLPAAEPVIGIEIGGVARAYPIRYLLRHEIVNDTVGTEPIVVTYCPLCNSAAAFTRRVAGRSLTFGVSGQLVNANVFMFDRETLSLWTQVEGRAFAGELERKRLRRLGIVMVSFGERRSTHPSGHVMRPPTGSTGEYATDPYAGYANNRRQESRFVGAGRGSYATTSDPRLAPKWRVLGVKTAQGAVAFVEPRRDERAVVKKSSLGEPPLSCSVQIRDRDAGTGDCAFALPQGDGAEWSGRNASPVYASMSWCARAPSSTATPVRGSISSAGRFLAP